MSNPDRHALLRQKRLKAGLCTDCGQPREQASGHRLCGVCREKARHKAFLRACGKGQGGLGVRRANGRRASRLLLARGTATVIIKPREVRQAAMPKDSWWTGNFDARKAAEQARMRCALLPRSVVVVVDEAWRGDEGKF